MEVTAVDLWNPRARAKQVSACSAMDDGDVGAGAPGGVELSNQ